MGIAEFAPILTIGLGRALLHLREHDAAPYRKAILHACLHSMVYDRQTEHSREQYLLDIINLTGERDFYRSHILAAAPLAAMIRSASVAHGRGSSTGRPWRRASLASHRPYSQ